MKKLLPAIALFGIILTGCDEREETVTPTETESAEEFSSASQTRVQVPAPMPAEYRINPDNPYSLHNIQRALKFVEGANAPVLAPTHHYVRFLPQDSTHMYILIDSLDLDIFPYPRDWMLTSKEREVYKNAETNGFPWYYCIVEPDFRMPVEMESQFLDYAYVQPYIPDGSPDDSIPNRGQSYQLSDKIFAEVLDRSIEITGNAAPQAKTRANTLQLAARITYVSGESADPAPIPLKNVHVRVNWFLGTSNSYTNADGEAYMIGLPSGGGHHLIIWDNDKWKIREHQNWDKAKTEDSGDRTGIWDLQIGGNNVGVNTRDEMWATIHRALDAYYYGSYPKTAGLIKFDSELNVWARYGEGGHADFSGSRGGDQIHVYSTNPYNNTFWPKTKILAMTFHELGHASHHTAVGLLVSALVENRLCETWANGVQYAYTSSLYPNGYREYMEFRDDNTAVMESLMWQGMTLYQLQNIFMSKFQLDQCIQPVKDFGVVPDRLVDAIFGNSLLDNPIRANLVNRTISGLSTPIAETQEETYSISIGGLDEPKVAFNGWNVAPDYPNGTASWTANGGSLSVIFNNIMGYTLTANFILPDGSTYPITKRIMAKTPPPPAIFGTSWSEPNRNETYSLTNMSSGYVFTKWTVSPSTYTTTSGLNNPTLNVIFTAEGDYTLTASFTRPGGFTYTVSKTVRVEIPYYPPSYIIGPDQPEVSIPAQYTFPALQNGVTFTGWTIYPPNPDAYSAPNGVNNPALDITFYQAGTYVVAANFLLPNDPSPYFVDKHIRVNLPLEAFYPSIQYQSNNPVSVGDRVMFYVPNVPDYITDYHFEWEVNGQPVPNSTMSSISWTIPSGGLSVQCRLRSNSGNRASQWGYAYVN